MTDRCLQEFHRDSTTRQEFPRSLAEDAAARAWRDNYGVGFPPSESRMGCGCPVLSYVESGKRSLSISVLILRVLGYTLDDLQPAFDAFSESMEETAKKGINHSWQKCWEGAHCPLQARMEDGPPFRGIKTGGGRNAWQGGKSPARRVGNGQPGGLPLPFAHHGNCTHF